MNYIKDIALKSGNNWNMIIEIPKGTNSKYELVDGTFDRIEEVRKVVGKYPFYYGCFPQTYAGDKDPLDAVLLSSKKFSSLDVVAVQPIAVIKTVDNGEQDDKIICMLLDENHKKLNKQLKVALKFLNSYKGKHSNTIIDPIVYSADEAINTINATHVVYDGNNVQNIIKVDF